MRRGCFFLVGGLILAGLALFALIQLIPFGKTYTNPPVISEPAWDSPQTREIAQRACFDCHSNETVWPWYSRVAPMSWLVARDVNEGREKLNFSEWPPREMDELDELIEVVQEGEMPMPIYLPLHPEANLSTAEKQTLIEGFRRTFQITGAEHDD